MSEVLILFAGNDNALEQQDTPKDIFDYSGHVAGRILGLSCGDGNGLSAAVCLSV